MQCPERIGPTVGLTVALAMTSVLVAACAGAGTSSAPASAAQSSDEPSDEPPSASAAAGVAELCPPGMESDVTLDPGDYLASNLDPAVTVTVPAGTWTVGCADETFSLFGDEGAIAVIGDVRTVMRAGEPVLDADLTPEAMVAALEEAGVTLSDPEAVTVSDAAGLQFTVTSDADGMGFRNEQDRGWGFTEEEGDATVTLVEVADNTVMAVVRHGDDPALAEIVDTMQIGG